NALVKQYMKFFEMDNIELEFTEGALTAIARKALKRNTGARGLRAVIEEAILDVMYDLPSESNVSKCIISEEVINDNKDPELIRINKKEESA
ncbi:MAG: ATP-dependent Clp protease ATP-binding subunit ClpX, partial [Halanaerobiaceae bacterium]|nr:ATP-dependent Clp protease ATP-binding subunit ClpX [Halanaerobiaceae bacterium]